MVDYEEEIIETPSSNKKRCSDFDEDCNKIEDHFYCFIGNKNMKKCDGYCPFVHNPN